MYVCWDYRAIARIVLLVHVCVSATAEQAYYDITRPVLCSPRKLSTSDCRGACQDLSICMTSNGLCCGTDTLTMQGKNTSLRMFLRTPYLFAFEKPRHCQYTMKNIYAKTWYTFQTRCKPTPAANRVAPAPSQRTQSCASA